MINVNKDNSRKLGKGESLYLTFKYDAEIVSQVKSISTRHYIGDIKAWEIPLGCIQEVIDIFKIDNLNIAEDVDLDYTTEAIEIESCDLFSTQLDWVKSPILKEFATKCLKILPEYFFTVAASSTGKYHPNYALGEGGLVRHTKAAMIIAKELFGNDTVHNLTDEEQDMVLVSLLLHDGVKHGLEGSKFTVATHPIEVVKLIESNKEICEIIPEETLSKIFNCISSHMGQWNTDYKTKKEILPKPDSELGKFVHLCDYLASRKMIEINFN